LGASKSKIQNPKIENPTMLRRIIYEDWQLIFPVVALAVASLVYLVAAWRGARMTSAQSDRLARLPLED
jgi:hypothetical protein